MWGIRAIRAVWLAAVLLAAVGGGGCRHGGVVDEKRVNELSEGSFQSGPPVSVQPGDKTAVPVGNDPSQKRGSHLTTERIHGGII